MDDRAFADLSKRVARADSRRGMLGMMGALVGAALGAAVDDVEAAFGYCHPPQTPCQRDQKCCSGKCNNGVCTCNKRGAPCLNKVGIACCSQRCRKGKCR